MSVNAGRERLGVVVTGVAGRMGRSLVQAVAEADGLVLSGATERAESDAVGRDVGELTGGERNGVVVKENLADALEGAAVVIDFTLPEASLGHAKVCAEHGVALVLGTTGFSFEAKREIAAVAKQVPVVMAPNMSVGVNVLFKLAAQVARILGDEYDVEMVEVHHRHKRDAPSGTGVKLCEVVAESLGLDYSKDVIHSREGDVGARPDRKIGVGVLRGGDVVGDHTVMFLGDGERLELTHRAGNRMNFAKGATRAARWVAGRPAALYDMQDVLGLREGQS